MMARNPDGTFPEGQSGNPAGRPRNRMTWQNYADRIDYYLNEYTRGEIKKLVLDPDEFDKLVTRDALVVQTIAESLQVDGLPSRKELLNRIIGTPIEKAEIMGKGGNNLFISHEELEAAHRKLLGDPTYKLPRSE
jgi:hypothetical protein